MGRYNNNTVRADGDVNKVLEHYVDGNKISCRGRKLAANDLGIGTFELDEILERYGVERMPMKRGKS